MPLNDNSDYCIGVVAYEVIEVNIQIHCIIIYAQGFFHKFTNCIKDEIIISHWRFSIKYNLIKSFIFFYMIKNINHIRCHIIYIKICIQIWFLICLSKIFHNHFKVMTKHIMDITIMQIKVPRLICANLHSSEIVIVSKVFVFNSVSSAFRKLSSVFIIRKSFFTFSPPLINIFLNKRILISISRFSVDCAFLLDHIYFYCTGVHYLHQYEGGN